MTAAAALLVVVVAVAAAEPQPPPLDTQGGPALDTPPPSPPATTTTTPTTPADQAAVVVPPGSIPPVAVGKPVALFRFKLAGISDDERAQLDRFLMDLIGKRLDDDVIKDVVRRLLAVRRYSKAKCTADQRAIVTCDITRARVLREVKVEGLPAALLESDVSKRIFLKPGEPLDEDDTSGKSRLVRQRLRIEELLEREGFMGAEVRLLVKKAAVLGEFNVTVRVRGGSFVDVNRVILRAFNPIRDPLSQRALVDSFGRMCLTSEGVLDGFFMGLRVSCFNKRRLQATIEHFTEKLHAMGYPEARVRVQPMFIDPAHADNPDCALSSKEMEKKYKSHGLNPPPQCVNLLVDVEPGTKATVRFHPPPGGKPLVETPEFLGSSLLWARETFIEPVSRELQLLAEAPPSTALDTELVEERLKEQLSFEEAGAVDETEIDVTARRVDKYVGTRGRLTPEVTVEDQAYPGERVIDFYIEPSIIAAVRSVRFVGNRKVSTEEIEKNTDLAAHVRSLVNSGSVSIQQLADDEERIRSYYAQRGFPEANVQADAALAQGGVIDVTFFIDEGTAFLLEGVVLAGGAPQLTPDVLKAIKHCEGGVAAQEKRDPKEPADCKGAPLRPEELEADAQRVQQVYASHGFPNVEVALETAFEAEGAKVRITVVPPKATDEERAHPKENNVRQVKLGEVFLEGNYVTRRSVLLREAGLAGEAGEPLDPVALGKGIARIRRSGLYDSVELQYLGLDGSFGGDRASVRLSVDERPAFTVDTSLGFSTEQLFTVRTEVRHKNLLGTMLDARWTMDFGLFIGRVSQTKGQITWPRILGTDVGASLVPLSLLYFDTPAGARLLVPSTTAGQKATSEWEAPDLRRRLFLAGASFSVDWRLQNIAPIVDDKLTLSAAVDLHYDWLNPSADPIPPFSLESLETVDGLLTALDVEPTRVASLTPRLQYNNLDNPFDPHEGFGIDVFVRGSTPPFVAQGPYGVFGASGRVYTTLFDRVTIALGGRTRLGFYSQTGVVCPDNQDGCQWALMQNDLLLLGGERSVRGVQENHIGVFSDIFDTQLKPVLDKEGKQQVQIRPGLYGGVVNLELRTVLVKQLFFGSLQGAVFADAGGSTDSFDPLPLPEIDPRSAWSVGAGLRYVTPVGPISVDYAYSPPRASSAGYLTLGYVF